MPPISFPLASLSPLGAARGGGGVHVPQSLYSLGFVAASSQYVEALSPAGFDSQSDWTLGCWFKAAAVPALQIAVCLGFDDGAAGNGLSFAVGDGSGGSGSIFTGLLPGVTWIPSGVTVSAATWYHAVMTHANVSGVHTTQMYLNGSAVGSASTRTPLVLSGQSRSRVSGQALNSGRYWDGKIDDVFICASVLSPAQIAALAAGALDPSTLTTAGLWRFEEGSGTSAADSSGNGNTGAFSHDPPTWSSDVPTQLQ